MICEALVNVGRLNADSMHMFMLLIIDACGIVGQLLVNMQCTLVFILSFSRRDRALMFITYGIFLISNSRSMLFTILHRHSLLK